MNDKVKSLFFSQYLGQKVTVHKKDDTLFEVDYRVLKYISENDYLLLRDISQLLDSEYKQLGQLYSECINQPFPAWFTDEHIVDSGKAYASRKEIVLPVFDYLRSIGILLPFTYLSESNQPITLTPAEIIALGWAKLQSNEQ